MKPRDPQKIERIHQATLALVSEIGLAGLTMSKIGKKAKVGMGTIYTYFESKEEIINSLYQALKHKHKEEVYANFDENQSFLVNFEAIFRTFFHNSYHQEREYFFLEQCRASISLNLDSIVLEEAVFAKFKELLEEGKSLGMVRKMDNDLMIGYIAGGIQGFLARIKREGLPLTDALTEEALALCLNTIRI